MPNDVQHTMLVKDGKYMCTQNNMAFNDCAMGCRNDIYSVYAFRTEIATEI